MSEVLPPYAITVTWPARPAAFAMRRSSGWPASIHTSIAPVVLLPQVRFVDVRQPLAEFEALVREQRERDDAHHHPLVGFRRVTGHRQRVIGVVMPIHVGDLQFGFVDRGFQRHADAARAGIRFGRVVMIPNARRASPGGSVWHDGPAGTGPWSSRAADAAAPACGCERNACGYCLTKRESVQRPC
jgi:hypothetical protein